MATHESSALLAGVIEGFYGPPWTPAERLELFDNLAAWELNTYVYAPKDDLHHRVLWREPYGPAETSALRDLVRQCHEHALQFVYALGPGLDIRYDSPADLDQLIARFDQMLALGCGHFAVLFDDIPERPDAGALERWGSVAGAHSHIANTLFRWLRERQPHARFLCCPTPYCGRMADAQLGGPGYLDILGRDLLPEIDVCWTGPDIISREITVDHVRELTQRIRRPPVIWDNLHANDYDSRRFFCGPYAGRPPGLRQAVRGILSNPNCEFPLNDVPLRTLGAYLRATDAWAPRTAYLEALQAWWPRFETAGPALAFEDLLLLADCFYLPYDDGPNAHALLTQCRGLLDRDPAQWGEDAARFRHQAVRLRDCCAHLAALRDRPLFHALSRKLWELREELDLLEKYVAHHANPATSRQPFASDFHRPGTYRGSFVARLQHQLALQPDGTCSPRPNPTHPLPVA